MTNLLRRLRYLMRAPRMARDLQDELELHRELTRERLERAGVPADAAVHESRRIMGNVTLAHEDARGVWILPWIDGLRQDALYAVRQLVRQPGFALLAIGTLAVAIGLNSSLFAVYNAMAIKPWPVADAERVVTIVGRGSRDIRQRGGGAPGGFSLDELDYFSAQAKTLSGVVATRSGGGDQTLGESDVPASWVSGSYFRVLGVDMAHGRGFTDDEDRNSTPAAVAVISHAYWTREFGADPAIIGRSVRLEEVPFTVVGVTADDFTGTRPERTDVWLPMASAVLLRPQDRWVRGIAMRRENCCVAAAARLRPGVTREQAQAELTLLDRQFRESRKIAGPDDAVAVHGTEFVSNPKGNPGSAFVTMFAGVLLVLLLACANVGNLLIARAVTRRREIAVRLSLGASRARVVRQLLTEGVVLAALAGVIGLWLAYWMPDYLVSAIASNSALRLAPDATVLWFTVGVSVLACLSFALAPALHGTRIGVSGALKDGAPVGSARFRLRSTLLAVQVGVVIVLLCGAGVISRAIVRTSTQDFGFDLQGLSVASTEAPARGLEPARLRAVTAQMVSDLAHLDGVRLALTSTPPLGSGNIKGTLLLPGDREEHFNAVYEVSPGYFAITRTPLLAGRVLTPADAGRPHIVVNETLARRFWSVETALGKRIVTPPAGGGFNQVGELEIVGVVRDARMASLSIVDPTIYQPLSGRTLPHVLFVREDREAAGVAAAAARNIDGQLRTRITPLAENLRPRLQSARTAALAAGALGALALLLAAVGLFGVFAYWVQQRRHEIGIRMALGAGAMNVVGLVLRSSGAALAAGVVLGAGGTAASSRLLESYLFGLSPLDPAAYAGVAALLTTAGILATWIPARRATKVDPLSALRCE